MNKFEKFTYEYPTIGTAIMFFGFIAAVLIITSIPYIINALVLADW